MYIFFASKLENNYAVEFLEQRVIEVFFIYFLNIIFLQEQFLRNKISEKWILNKHSKRELLNHIYNMMLYLTRRQSIFNISSQLKIDCPRKIPTSCKEYDALLFL